MIKSNTQLLIAYCFNKPTPLSLKNSTQWNYIVNSLPQKPNHMGYEETYTGVLPACTYHVQLLVRTVPM